MAVTKPKIVKSPTVAVKTPKFPTTKVPSMKVPKPTGAKSVMNSMFT